MIDQNVPQPWQGRTTLVFALAAAAVGLGNFFRLPFLLGEHGGAPFFIAYVATLVLVVAPLLAAEVMLGSSGRGSPVGAMRWATDQSGRRVEWSWLGLLQSVLALILAAKLLVYAGWSIDRAQTLQAGTLAAASALDVAADTRALIDSPERYGPLVAMLLAGVTVLVALGPKYAMGAIGWVGLPAMAITCVGLLDFTLSAGDLVAADEFLFRADYDGFGFHSAMAGIISALYTAGAGLGIGLCFGGRAPRAMPLLRSVSAAVVIDTAFALVIAIVVVPLLLETNVEPVPGLPLVFVAIPYAYANLALGEIYGGLFFGLLGLASCVSVIALMEPATMFLRKDLALPRWVSAPLVALVVALLIVLLQWAPPLLANRLMTVVDGGVLTGLLLLSIFVGWRMPRPIVRGELYREPRWLFVFWWESLRLIVPVVLVLVAYWLWFSPVPTDWVSMTS